MRDALLDAQKPGSEPQLYMFLEPGEKVPEGAELYQGWAWRKATYIGRTIDAETETLYRVPVPSPTLVVAELERTLAAERRAMDMLIALNPDLSRDLEVLRRFAKKEAAE